MDVGRISVRSRDYGDVGSMLVSQLIERFHELNMWRKLNYCMSPVAMRGQGVKKGYEN